MTVDKATKSKMQGLVRQNSIEFPEKIFWNYLNIPGKVGWVLKSLM